MLLEIPDEKLNTMSFGDLETLFRLTTFVGCLLVVTKITPTTRQVSVDPEGRLLDMLSPYLHRPGVKDFLLRRLVQLLAQRYATFLWFDVDVPATAAEPYVWLRIYAPSAIFIQSLRQLQENKKGGVYAVSCKT